MIISTGIDIVEIERFSQWHTYSAAMLTRIYSKSEIAYCLESIPHAAQRFAVRFAAREALYKALSAIPIPHKPPFLTLCAAVTIERHQKRPVLTLQEDFLRGWYPSLVIPTLAFHLSLSHANTLAIAHILVEQRDSTSSAI